MWETTEGNLVIADYALKKCVRLQLRPVVDCQPVAGTEGACAEAVCEFGGDWIVTSYDDNTVRRVGRSPWVRQGFNHPWGLAALPAQQLIVVSEFSASRLHLLRPDGSSASYIGGGDTG